MHRHSLLIATFIAMALFLLASCQCHDTTASQQQNVSVSLNLSSPTVNVSGQLQFTATVTGTTDTGVTWYVNNIEGGNSEFGFIDSNGLYTAPAIVPSPATVTVKATSDADPTKSGTSTVTIQGSAVAPTSGLPGTGQTTSYAPGDDGDLRSGAAWPNPRFTVGTGPEADCVRDNLTGLMWVKSPDSTLRTWQQALDYANGLSRCGYDDWRMPNRKELWSLIDRSKVRPPLPDGNPFTNVQSDSYWSSTSWEYNDPSTNAWHFNMSNGETGGGSNKTTTSLYVWPVRSGQIGAVALPRTGQTASYATGDDGDLEKGAAWPDPRFIPGTGIETACVTDNLTGLMWVKNPDQTTRTWTQALDYANGLSLCGYDDWRLPNINDLESVVNLGVSETAAWLNTQGFSNLVTPAGCTYWSSTTLADNTDFAWRVGLCSGNVGAIGWYKTAPYYVWPVRSVMRTTRMSVDSAGNQANGESDFISAISADGRYVAFASRASNLVPNDTNDAMDIFVHDRQTGQTTRVSVNSAGNQGDNVSIYPSISGDGRYVAFASEASNLVAGDTNAAGDVFVHDRQTGQTTRVSVDNAGNQGDFFSRYPSISADGRYVAFASEASNLVAGDTNSYEDIFVHDRQTGQTTRVSVDSAGNQGNVSSRYPSISADGRYVAFASAASNLVAVDTNSSWDIFVHDRQTGQTTRVSVDGEGTQGNDSSSVPSISADGRYVAFESWASNLVAGDTNGAKDIFVHDRQAGETTRVSLDSAGNQANGPSEYPSISADGRYVAFDSDASNLVAGDLPGWDTYARDRQTGQNIRVSVDSAGNPANSGSGAPSISADGRFVAFASSASNLVADDTNGVLDVFVHQLR